MIDTQDRFSFGQNWSRFVRENLDRDRVETAKQSLKNFLGLETLEGKTFLDIGCGSGLFSLAAFELGASRIVSFDYDKDSLACCRLLHERASEPSNWLILQGSALDIGFLDSLGKFDIIYSWGVLHHTGAMWQAIENASLCIKEDGLFFLLCTISTMTAGLEILRLGGILNASITVCQSLERSSWN